MGPSSTFHGTDQSLPPLHQAIPEFHSHPSRERHASNAMPRRMVERGSPTFSVHRRVSQSPSSAVSDSSSMPALSSPSFHHRRAASTTCSIPNMPLTGRTVSSDPITDSRYDGPSYTSSSGDQRRISMVSSTSSNYANDNRASPFLPPVASLTSSRGSSFDVDPLERPQLPVTLPSLFAHTQQLPQSNQQSYTSPVDSEMRYQSPQEYHRYSTSSTPPYQSSSPGQLYSPYYSHPTYSQPPRNPGYSSTQPMMMDNRSPFSTGGHSVDMTMDHFDHGRPGKRRRGNLPKHVTDLLRGWLNDHLHHPYPTEDEKQMLMAQTGLNINQVSNWFINARRRRLPSITGGRVDTDQKPSHSMGNPGTSQ
ncbi:uncharacterized protein LAJ45_02744 [Morchella importuna]|nr:uncharacterized protein LAJ45_02744 [Morchella importuna]KAH8153157.1 hypothetical protein LAJ45_02744 [Morchella importuna]